MSGARAGLLDLHFHGAFGNDVSAPDGIPAIDAQLDADGVDYRYVATLPRLGTPPGQLAQQVADVVAGAQESDRCVGLRMEGAFLSPLAAGCWPPDRLAAPDVVLLDELIDAAEGELLIVDIAPELPRALDVIQRACERGVVASIAHTTATFEQALAGIDAGATLATHTFNAMPPLDHRAPGAAGAVLADPRVTCELIADGRHVHPAVCGIVARAKGPDGFVLVSDAAPVAGAPPGAWSWGPVAITIDADGHVTDDTGGLAGAGLLLHQASPDVIAAIGGPDAYLHATNDLPQRLLGTRISTTGAPA